MYDFMVFGYYAAAIGHVFFPSGNPFVSLMLSLMTFGAGFLMRPLGAIVLGAYTDLHGRRAGLILTLSLMSVGIVSIAFTPGYATIGLLAPLLILFGRLLQGFSAGMELGGVSVYLSEIATPGHKGFYVSWQSASQQVAVMVAASIGVILTSVLPPEKMALWGWRIPFALSIILVGIGLWVRLGILETPVFQKLVADKKIEHAPIVEVIKKQPREIILSALIRMSEQAPFYIFTAFVFSYGVGTLKMSRDLILMAVLVASVVSFISIPLSGHISDLIGRRRMYRIGAVVMGLFGFLYFGMLDTAIPWAVFLAIVISLIPHDMQYGPQAALIAEAFTPRLRYSGASLGYQLASVIAGGPAPLIATALFAIYGSGYAIAVYIAVCALITLVSAAFMPDYTGQDIASEYDEGA